MSFPADNTSLVDQDATITVTPEFNGCLGIPQTFVITVKPKPNVFATPITQEYCFPEKRENTVSTTIELK